MGLPASWLRSFHCVALPYSAFIWAFSFWRYEVVVFPLFLIGQHSDPYIMARVIMILYTLIFSLVGIFLSQRIPVNSLHLHQTLFIWLLISISPFPSWLNAELRYINCGTDLNSIPSSFLASYWPSPWSITCIPSFASWFLSHGLYSKTTNINVGNRTREMQTTPPWGAHLPRNVQYTE